MLPDIIRKTIREQGPINLATYMNLCLCHPVYGYYMTRDPFGRGGDFITAPEVSQMFGEVIGAWAADLWIKMGRPGRFTLIECGPGRGTLMADMLRATRGVPGFHGAMSLTLMEVSPVLRNAQGQVLQDYDPRWIENLQAVSQGFPVILIGNEFLDALPVRQFVFDGGWQEICVGLDETDTLGLVRQKRVDEAVSLPERPEPGALYEISSETDRFIKDVDNLLGKAGGAALFLDYGYTKTAPGDTLQAVRAHRAVGILDAPGESDLTFHVNFERVADLAHADGIACFGPVEQGAFLISLGIFARAQILKKNAGAEQASVIDSALHRLVDPGQMGALFKVMCLCHDENLRPEGF